MSARRGVTIIESLVVVLIGTLILGVVLGLLNFSTRSFGRSQQRLNPRELASKIQMELRRHLTDARRYRIGAGGRELMFISPREVAVVTFDHASGAIQIRSLQSETDGAETIACGIKHFSIHQLRRGVLRVSLEIDRPLVWDGLASLGPLSLVDEIHCPAAARNRMVPWNRTFEARDPRG